jgi:hypothetical protein
VAEPSSPVPSAPSAPSAHGASRKSARAQKLAGPLLIGAIVWVIALSALLHGIRGEAEARRSLTLRAADLIGWLGHEVAGSCDRSGFAGEGGPSDAAPAWRDVLAAAEEAAAIAMSTTPKLPSLAADARLNDSLRAATGARRFTAFNRADELVENPWPRRARVFARMLANGCSERRDRAAWLAGAVALASDLRSVGTLEHGAAAAEIDDAILLRLDDGAVDAADAARLTELLLAARTRLPVGGCVANRETRVLQATVCALAEIAPLRGGRLRSDDEPPLPLLQADEAVTRFDQLPLLLLPLLAGSPDVPALRAFNEWRDAFGRDLPRLASLLPTADAAAATAGAADKLDRLREQVRRHTADPGAR